MLKVCRKKGLKYFEFDGEEPELLDWFHQLYLGSFTGVKYHVTYIKPQCISNWHLKYYDIQSKIDIASIIYFKVVGSFHFARDPKPGV